MDTPHKPWPLARRDMEAVFEAETLMGNEEHQERRRGSDGSPEVCVKPPAREVRNDKAIKRSKKL